MLLRCTVQVWHDVYMIPQHQEGQSTLHELMQENNRLAKENNRLLKKIHRSNVFAFWMKLLMLLVFIGAPVFIYQYYLQDYIVGMFETYTVLQQDVGALTETVEQEKGITELLQLFTGGISQ